MVGVPGRSKACNTCKLRKVSCSREKPECKTCIKANRLCAGYQRERIFITDQRRYEAPKNDLKSKSQKTNVELSNGTIKIPKSQTMELLCCLGSGPPRDGLGHSKWIDSIGALMLKQSPSALPSYRQQIVDEFISSTMPMYSSGYNITERPGVSNWMAMVPSLPNMGSALESTLLAVSLAKLGRADGNQALIQESLRFYGKGLRELQKALWNPAEMFKDETLAACMTLIVYEVFECPDGNLLGFLNHVKGCTKLFQMRGPDGYTSDLGSTMFQSFRLTEIQQAYTEKRDTYVGSQEWMEKPWIGREKSTLHELLDIMAVVSGIIGDAHQALTGPLTGTVLIDPSSLVLLLLQLIDRCWKTDSKLRGFYAKLESETLGPVYWPQFSGEASHFPETADEEIVFHLAFYFPDLRIAHICILYWATCAILWSGMEYIYRLVQNFNAMTATATNSDPDEGATQPTPLFDITQLPPLEYRSDLTEVCRNICQSMEYCLRKDFLDLGARASVFPLKVAIEALNDIPGCERECLWAQGIMKQIDEGGLKLLGHLPISMTEHAFLPSPTGYVPLSQLSS